MELQARIPYPSIVEAALHHLQRGHLLGHEKHGLPIGHSRCDDVCNRLRFACAGRTLNHKVAAFPDIVNRERL